MSRLAEASASSREHMGAIVAESICTYVADRTGQPSAGFMRGDAIATLEACGIEQDLVNQTAQLIATCEHLQYAGGENEELTSIIQNAKDLVAKLDDLSILKTRKQGSES